MKVKIKKMNKVAYIREQFLQHQITLSQRQAEQFVDYYQLLIEWNQKMNLTAITNWDEVVVKHFIDSVLSHEIVDYHSVTSLIDIGTGAGFPGIPLKILYPHLRITLLDALNKRILFLEHVIDVLGLENVELVHGRAEDLARTEHRESYDICVSRAVSQLNVLCEYCLPFINLGGRFISYKGAKTLEELEMSHNAINLLGGKEIFVTDEAQLDIEVKRGFVIIEKIGNTPDKYPRKAGKPLKKPLV